MQHWSSFLYLYGVGGAIFGTGLFLGIRKRVLRLERRSDRRLLAGIVGAYVFYFLLQGAWNLAVLSWDPKESAPAVEGELPIEPISAPVRKEGK